jgi:hypothetical protein
VEVGTGGKTAATAGQHHGAYARIRIGLCQGIGKVGDPVLIQIGYTRFALRRAEAARVAVRSGIAA